jgi:hypothetical protein
MKTIFETVDPKFMKCSTGTCEHVSHKPNMCLPILLIVSAVLLIFHAKKNDTFQK